MKIEALFYAPLGATAATFEGHGNTSSATVAGIGALHYQFGRTAPIAATLGTTPTVEAGTQNFAWAIKNPMTFVTFNGNWTTQDTSTAYMYNDKNVAADSDAKSIFDPSPIGWRLPIQGVWSNFSLETFTVSSSGRQHTDNSAAYYPYSGIRSRTSGALSTIGSSGYCWTSSPTSASNGSFLYFASSSVGPSNGNNRANGFPARPIRE